MIAWPPTTAELTTALAAHARHKRRKCRVSCRCRRADGLGRHRARRRFAGERGFTLIEMLIALALLTVILALVSGAFRTITNGWEHYARALVAQDMLLRARAILERDIATMQRVIWSGEKAIKYVFRGRTDALTFVAIAPPYPSTPGPYFITYAVAPAISADGRAAGKAALVRSRTRYHPEIKSFAALDAAAGADPEGGSVVRPRTDNVPIIEGPFAYRFSYGAPDGTKWRWQSPWPFDDKLPALIRLEIKDARSGRPVAAPIILRPRIELERACLSTKKRIRGCSQRRGGQAQPGAGKAAKEKLKKATSDAKAPG